MEDGAAVAVGARERMNPALRSHCPCMSQLSALCVGERGECAPGCVGAGGAGTAPGLDTASFLLEVIPEAQLGWCSALAFSSSQACASVPWAVCSRVSSIGMLCLRSVGHICLWPCKAWPGRATGVRNTWVCVLGDSEDRDPSCPGQSHEFALAGRGLGRLVGHRPCGTLEPHGHLRALVQVRWRHRVSDLPCEAVAIQQQCLGQHHAGACLKDVVLWSCTSGSSCVFTVPHSHPSWASVSSRVEMARHCCWCGLGDGWCEGVCQGPPGGSRAGLLEGGVGGH